MGRYLTVDRIEFVVTYLCNSRCRHCYSICRRDLFPPCIDRSLALEIVGRVGEKYRPESIMTFGGEPMLFPDIVYAIHRKAMEVGIPIREVITNGYWSNSFEEIEKMAGRLVESGVNNVFISVDVFHQEYIPLNIVRRTAEVCLNAGIENVSWAPCWVVSEEDDNWFNHRTRKILKELEDIPVKDISGNVLEPEGLALVNLRDFLPPRRKIPEGRCGEIPYTDPLDSVKSICVEPDGKIAVCKDFYIGNAAETDIIELIENYNPFKIPEMRAIIENGMKGLVEWARSKGVEPDPKGYYSICQMCIDIRSRVDTLQRNKHFKEK